MRDLQFRWSFRPGPTDSDIVVIGPERSGRRLVATLRGWQDPWLALNGFVIVGDELQLKSSARNTPAIVSPGFVRQVIEDALDGGWDPLSHGPDMCTEYAGREHGDEATTVLTARALFQKEEPT